MKALEPFSISLPHCRRELTSFAQLLATNSELSEEKDIRPFFQQHKHLSAYLGTFNPRINTVNRIAFQFDLFGDFLCDLVVGDAAAGAYSLIEFEDARMNSVFQGGSRSTPYWAGRFEHGYSQVIDWLWKIDRMRHTSDFAERFGGRQIDFFGILIIGRNRFLSDADRSRMGWRLNKVVIDSAKLYCLTFDDLLHVMDERLSSLERVVSGDDA